MSGLVVAICAALGLFAGSAAWVFSRNQATKRPVFGPPPDDADTGSLPMTAWLPFYGFGAARSATGSQGTRKLIFELLAAGYFALAAARIDDGLDLAGVLLFTLPLMVIFLVDSWTRLIHTEIIGIGIALGLVFATLDGFRQLGSSALAMVLAALAFAGFFILAVVIYRNPKVVPFGLGDVYLAAMIGSMVRMDGVARALLYGIFLAGGIIALLLVTKRVNRKQAIPYGPYLVLGALFALVL